MKKIWLIVIGVLLFLVLGGLVFKTKFLDRQSPGALQVKTIPSAIVFIDGVQAGVTGEEGYKNDDLEPGEHTIRLVSENADEAISWEGKVNLTSGIMVAIDRILGIDENSSSGEVLTLEEIGSKNKSALSVISVPDQAVVKIDGEPKGFAPKLLEDLAAGDYQVVVSSLGYRERVISAKTFAGYKLVINVRLSKEIEGIEEATDSAEPESQSEEEPESQSEEIKKPYVRIKETPTGWLRVRKSPSTGSVELAKLKLDETYPYLEEKENGWYKIEYEEGEEGWVSGVYIELVE